MILIKQAAISLSDLFVDYFGPNRFTITLNQFHLIIFLSVKIIVQQSNLYQSLAREPEKNYIYIIVLCLGDTSY